jgi:hypothetical protein
MVYVCTLNLEMIIKKSRANQMEVLDLLKYRVLLVCILSAGALVVKDYLLFVIGLGMVVVISIPTIYLHIEYLFLNTDDYISVNTEQRTFAVVNQHGTSTYAFGDIEEIIVYVCPNLLRGEGSIKYLSFENYHFAIIKLGSGVDIKITCLMVNPIDKFLFQFSGVPISYRRIFYPSYYLRKLSWK